MLATVLHRTHGYTGEMILGDGTVLEFVNGQAGPTTITFADAQSLTVMGFAVVTTDTPSTGYDLFTDQLMAPVVASASSATSAALANSATLRAALGLPVATTVTSAGALVVQKHNPADATTGPLTMTLPTGAAAGSLISAEKTDSSTNAVTVSGNMRGASAQSIPLTTAHEVRVFVADGAGSWWPIADHRTTASLDNAYGRVFTAEAYGALGDGATDDTTAVNAAIAAVQAAGGGTLLLNGTKTYRCLGAIVFTTTGPSNAPVQKPVRITSKGGSGGWNGYWPAAPVNGGAVLDLRYDGTDTLHPAKIDSRGAGVLEIDHITLMSGGSDDFPILQTTNTTLFAHHNAVVGNAAKSGTACVQDVFVLGGTTTTIGNTATAPFQGYGSKISENFFSNIRRGVYGRVYANAVVVRDNTFSLKCGNASGGAITVDGDPAGNTAQTDTGWLIEGNLIEVTNYQYGIVARNSVRQQVIANNCYDSTATTKAAVWFDNAQYNLLIDGFNTPGLKGLYETGTARGTTTRLTPDQSVPSMFAQPLHGYGQMRAVSSGTDSTEVRSIAGSGDQAGLWVTPASNPNPEVGLVSVAASQVTDGATTSGSNVVTSATAAWTANHEGLPIKGTGIPTGSRIVRVNSGTQIEMTKDATATATGVTLNFVSFSASANQEVGFNKRHLRSKGAIGAATPNANAGTGGTATVQGTDMAWTLTLTTGTTPAAGAQASVAAGINWANPPKLALTPKNAAAAGQSANVYLTDTIGATVLNAVAPLAASTAYIWDLMAIE